MLELLQAAQDYYSYSYADPTMGFSSGSSIILMGIIGVVGYIVQARLQSVFAKYSQVPFPNGMTGAEVAEKMLRDNNVHNVKITHVKGQLTDHFNPANMTVNLSDSVYASRSIAAAAVACHECGHAIQHARGYAPLVMRSALVPVVNLGSNLYFPLFMLGLVFSWEPLVYVGIACFGLSLVFQLVTLPVEFNASRRAMLAIEEGGLLTAEEQKGARKTLKAAALTYVAATATALAQLLRLVLIFGGRRRRD